MVTSPGDPFAPLRKRKTCAEFQVSRVPPNVQFQIDDAELDWTFKKNSFDLVHIRNLGGAIKDWEKLLKEAYKFRTSY